MGDSPWALARKLCPLAECPLWNRSIEPVAQCRFARGGVGPSHRGSRLGLTVTGEALEAGKAAGWPAAVLIGAPAYFGEIGFTVTPKHQLIFPGPQDPRRVMVKSLAGDASQLSGLVTAA